MWRRIARDFDIIPAGEIVDTKNFDLFLQTRLCYSSDFWECAGLTCWLEVYKHEFQSRGWWLSDNEKRYLAGLISAGHLRHAPCSRALYEDPKCVMTRVAELLIERPYLCPPEEIDGVRGLFVKYRYNIAPHLPYLFIRAIKNDCKILAKVLCPAQCIIRRDAVAHACLYDKLWILELLDKRRGVKWGRQDLQDAIDCGSRVCEDYIRQQRRHRETKLCVSAPICLPQPIPAASPVQILVATPVQETPHWVIKMVAAGEISQSFFR
jgi:hypothetical protein